MMHSSRWNFFQSLPNPGESTNDYVNRLVNIGVACDFENFSMKEAIMQNLLSYSLSPCLRQVVLNEELGIDQILILAKKVEEKCALEMASFKLMIDNQHSNEQFNDVAFVSPKTEKPDDTIDEFNNDASGHGYINDDNINEDDNDDSMDNEINYDHLDNTIPYEDPYEKNVGKPVNKSPMPTCPHIFNIVKNKYKKYVCELCGIAVRSVSKLNSRMRKVQKRQDNRAYRCMNCDKLFTSIATLKQHDKIHQNPRTVADKTEAPEFKLHKPKRETTNPGILILHDYKFYCFSRSEKINGTQRYHYVCSERESNHQCYCSATITTEFDPTGQEAPKNILTRWPQLGDHSHEPEVGDVVTQEMIREMEERIAIDPNRAISSIKKEVMAEYETKYRSTDPAVWEAVLTEMAKFKDTDHINRRIRRVRSKLIGNLRKEEFEPDVRNLADNIMKEMERRVEADPSVQLLKVHDEVVGIYESQFGHQEKWANVILALGKVGSRLQRLRKRRTKLVGDVPLSMFMFSRLRENKN